MTTLFATHMRIGGDPRHLEAFKSLCTELAKLDHPACPDVDWARVEGLCLVVFRDNGIDLQSAVAFILALGNQRGVGGLVQGFALLEALVRQWPGIWPKADATRLEILDWLYQRAMVMLRGLSALPASLSAVLQLQAQVERLQSLSRERTDRVSQGLTLLQQYIAALVQQLERNRSQTQARMLDACHGQAEVVMPLLILPPTPIPSLLVAEPQRGKVRSVLLGMAGLLIALLAWAGWTHWQSDRSEAARLSEVVSLNNLALFEPGSAELRGDSTKALVEALVDIKARPGRLIVITGHADSTGDSIRNLELSGNRAQAVRAWLQRMSDLPDDCFAIRNAADSQPVAGNDSEPGRAANRRVEIRLLPQAQPCGTG